MSNNFESGIERFMEKLDNMGYEYHADDWFRPVDGEEAGEPDFTRDQMTDAAGFSESIVNEYCNRLRKASGWK